MRQILQSIAYGRLRLVCWTIALTLLLYQVVGGQTTTPATQPSLGRVYAHEAFTLGDDASLRNIRGIYRPGTSNYWRNYISENAERYVALGLRGQILHLPWGTPRDAGGRLFYAIDSWQHAPKWLKDDFVEQWRRFNRRHPTFEVIAYVGPHPFDPSTRLTVERVRAAVKPAVDAGMSIAFDASALFDQTDIRLQVMRELWDDGVPVYCESWATAARPWMGEFHQLVTPAVWLDVQKNPAGYVPREQIGGQIVIWTANVFSSPQSHAQTYRDLLSRGVFAAGPIRYFWEVKADPHLIER